MTLDLKLKEIEKAKADIGWELQIITGLLAALRLAVEQRDSVMGDYTLDRVEKIWKRRDSDNAAILAALNGEGRE